MDSKWKYSFDCKRKKNFLFLFFCFISLSNVYSINELNNADSIIIQLFRNKEVYGKYIENYTAQIYLKGNAEVLRKNILFNYAPDFFYLNKGNDNSFVESLIDVRYTSPGRYTQDIKALNGSRMNAEDILSRIMPFLNASVYDGTMFDDQIILPDQKSVFRYYGFAYAGAIDTLGWKIHQIQITPKIKSQQLISGFIYIVDNIWTVYKFDLKGRVEFSDFRVETEFGLPQNNFLLPLKTSIVLHLNLLGNEIINSYYALFQYESVKLYNWKEKEKILSYDLSDYLGIQKDSLPIIKDSLFWNKKRPIPLTDYEETLYETQLRIEHEADSMNEVRLKREPWNYARGIFTSKKMHYNNARLTYSGLLNPFKFSYSKMDGIVYWQQFRFISEFRSGQILEFRPDIGFLVRKDEIYFNIPAQWFFIPEKLGSVCLSFANGNQSFNSNTIKKIENMIPDSINFDDLDIDYFRRYHLELESQYELTNGLLLRGGIDYDWYSAVNEGDNTSHLKMDNVNGDINDMVSDKYKAFSAVIGLRWTPGQYYRFNGKRKEYVGSKFPSFSAEYARGFKDVLRSDSEYERIEFDIQQKIPVGLMRSLHYYVGTGWFTNTKSVYFADFKKFRRQNIPQSWDDPLGGVFHLLRGDWYNASNHYVQAHFMYESPFALLQLFKGVTRDVLQERIYASQLYTPALPCYTEIGYGVGNFLGNVGVFFSLNKGKFESVGARIAFDLR